jgi:hypothetical protein
MTTRESLESTAAISLFLDCPTAKSSRRHGAKRRVGAKRKAPPRYQELHFGELSLKGKQDASIIISHHLAGSTGNRRHKRHNGTRPDTQAWSFDGRILIIRHNATTVPGSKAEVGQISGTDGCYAQEQLEHPLHHVLSHRRST